MKARQDKIQQWKVNVSIFKLSHLAAKIPKSFYRVMENILKLPKKRNFLKLLRSLQILYATSIEMTFLDARL